MVKNTLTVFFCLTAHIFLYGNFNYKPSVGDKFQYKISRQARGFDATFIYDLKNKVPVFHYKWGSEPPLWGTWYASKKCAQTLIKDVKDTSLLKNCNMIYLTKEVLKLLKSGKKINLTIQETAYEFKLTTTLDYNLPIDGAGIPLKILSATSSDNKWIINILDNPSFPLIVALLGDVSWQLQTIIPVPMYPITQDLTGKLISDKKADMFNKYIKETCVMIEASFTEKFRKVVFKEYFCPLVGVRFSLKNDTIVSLLLLSENSKQDGYTWQTYRGYVWGIYGLGDKRKTIEKQLGKPVSYENGKSYYLDKGFYLIYNSKGELEMVNYE